jgi:disulfide bond formation protein DsbB
MRRWSLPPLRPERRQAELEELLGRPRSHVPDKKSVAVLIAALQQTLDRQFNALEALDRKASILLGAILGIGVLSADRLRAPDWPALAPFAIAVTFSLVAIGASLVVLWSRTLLTGPNPIRAAQATEWAELPYSQSIADSLAVAAQANASVNEVKGRWLNFAFTAATIAVIAFAVLGLSGGGRMTEEQVGTAPSQTPSAAPVASEQPAPSATPSASEAPSASPPPSEGAFVHPRLGVAELREGWDPNAVPQPQSPPPSAGDHDG